MFLGAVVLKQTNKDGIIFEIFNFKGKFSGLMLLKSFSIYYHFGGMNLREYEYDNGFCFKS